MSSTESRDYIEQYTDKQAEKAKIEYMCEQEQIEFEGIAVYVFEWANETNSIIIDTDIKEAFVKADSIGDPYGVVKVKVYAMDSLKGLILDEPKDEYEPTSVSFEFCDNFLGDM